MKTFPSIAILTVVFSFNTVAAQELRTEAIDAAPLANIASERPAKASSARDPQIIRLQVLLDRAGASPGVVDGLYGENVSKAVAGFEAMHDLPVDGKLDPDIAVLLEGSEPIVENYVVTQEDTTGLVDAIPKDYGEKAKMDSMGYTSVAEKLSEIGRAHV